MKRDTRFYTAQNREAWNEVMPRHQAASKERWDRLFSDPGYTCQKDGNLLEVLRRVDVKGKDIVHLCCNNGVELLSLKNMGAGRCLGIDISDEAVAEAAERAEKCRIDCEFVRSDVYDVPEELHGAFDIVHVTAGCIGWMPDLVGFFRIAYRLMRVNGILLMHEIHPFSEMLPFDGDAVPNSLQIVEPYFRDEAIVDNTSLDYVGGTDYDAKTQYWFVHTISSLATALSDSGLSIEHFSEHTQDISAGHSRQERLEAAIPLSFILVAKKR